MKQGLLLVLAGLFALTATANELVLKPGELARQGYVAVARARGKAQPPAFSPHSLRWPADFEDSRHTIGNVMTQFQNYGGGAYYHGGDDLRVKSEAWVLAPVSGRLEAGHYGYETLPNGQNKKFFKAWPETGNSMYFEVAVIDERGYRFELHHVNRDTLTPAVLEGLRSGHGKVKAGDRLGQVVEWPNSDTDDTTYNHTHYNIISPDGVNLNPEHYSVEVGDAVAPEISRVFAVGTNVRELKEDKLRERPDELVVVATDRLADNIYTHTPAYARLSFEDGRETTWDFRERLAQASGAFPPIWDFFREQLRLPGGEVLRTRGNYSARVFLLRLRVPRDARGKFRVEIGDAAGNVTTRSGELDPR